MTCANHHLVAAAFRCDGCSRTLCADCVEEGHRLLFCRSCGERALPLAVDAPATAPALRAAQRRSRAAAYTFTDALGYPLRGTGAAAYWSLVAALFLLELASAVPFFGIFAAAFGLLFVAGVALLLPRFLFSIAATTADGEDELPDWPDFDFWELTGDALRFLAIALLCFLPAAALIRLTGCGPLEMLLVEPREGRCLAALVPGFVIAAAVGIPAFASTAAYRSPWLFFRVDLHARAVAVAPGEWARAVAAIAGMMLVGAILPGVLSSLPLIGSLLATAIQLYALFLGAHLAGVWFRRHPEAMARAYRD
ncbi:MAG TPA: B-box zinc finger protein [Thermoanaerobaculia bacterium]|nr:B-box zinc finger protein [Thermoanaerobaculia bacterium]